MTETEHIGAILDGMTLKCPHTRTEVRYKTFANGTKHLCVQCLDCGEQASPRWLSQEGIDLESVPPFDYGLESRCKEQRQCAATARVERERLARHLEYERYIGQSPHWQAVRQRIMQRDSGLCQACLMHPATDVHHRTYEHFGDEIMWELVAVCRQCHERIHGRQKVNLNEGTN